MNASVAIQFNDQRISVTLDAVELNHDSLTCELPGIPNVQNRRGAHYQSESLRILCVSGMAFARSRLAIPKGLAITVSELSGVVDQEDEVGICHAIAIGIAKSVNRAPGALLEVLAPWQLIEV